MFSSIRFESKNPTPASAHPETSVPPSPSTALRTDSSLETMQGASNDGFRQPNTLWNKAIKWISNLITRFLIAIRLLSKPDRELTGDAVYDQLDELIKHPDQFLKVLGETVREGEDPNNINLKTTRNGVTLLTALCRLEGVEIGTDQGHFKISSKVIEYVLKNAPGIDLYAKDSQERTLLFSVRSATTMKLIVERAYDLIEIKDVYKRTLLFTRVEEYTDNNQNPEIINYLISIGANLRVREPSFKHTPLHVCKHQSVAEMLLQSEPSLVFVLNECFQTPVDTAPDELKPYLKQFAESHKDLGPNIDEQLRIAVGKALSQNKEENNPLNPALIRELIEKGARVGIPLKLFNDETRPVLEWIIAFCNDKDPWLDLVSFAIKNATQEDIGSALEYALTLTLKFPAQPVEPIRLLVAAYKYPCKNLIIEERSLKDWDQEKNWGLFKN